MARINLNWYYLKFLPVVMNSFMFSIGVSGGRSQPVLSMKFGNGLMLSSSSVVAFLTSSTVPSTNTRCKCAYL